MPKVRCKHKLTTVLLLVLIPPATALLLAAALGWLRFDWSLRGAVYVLGAYAGWIAILAGLAEIGGFLREKEQPGPSPGTLYQAPERPRDFVGRQAKIKHLTRTLKPGATAAIAGMGGIGKTELARLVAFHVAGRFRDGVLWANFELEDIEAIVDRWAGALDQPQLPGDDMPAKATAWRGLISSKELLLIFDNVQPRQHIEPLLPSFGRNAVLITTRNTDHPALRNVETVSLDQFTHAEAAELAEEVVGKSAVQHQASDASYLFQLLGYLPLAVSIALYLARDCDFTLAYLNTQLEQAGAIKVLDSAENLRKSLHATFQTAWKNLPKDLKLTFRTLALFNTGPSFSTAALADTMALEHPEARARLRRLLGRSLLNQAGEDRWTLHTLVREFAKSRKPVDKATYARMARHYVKLVAVAETLFLQGGDGVLRGLKLFDYERAHIQAGQSWSASNAEGNQEAIRLCRDYPDAAPNCLNLRLHSQEWIAWLEASNEAACLLEDKEAQGRHLGNLGNAYSALGQVERAIEHYDQALAIAREIGDRRGEGHFLGNLGNAYSALGQVERARDYLQQALVIFQEIKSPYADLARKQLAELQDE